MILSLICATTVYAYSQTVDAADKDRDRSKYAVNNFAEDDKYTMLEPYETIAVQEPTGKKVKNIIFMIEGSMIDDGGHNNKAGHTMEEVFDFDKTLVIVTCDHATGGMTLLSGSIEEKRIRNLIK